MIKKKLKIAIVSKLWEETSPGSRGGTGSSIGYLVNGLVDRGHQVTLFATADSKTKAQKLISVRKTYYKSDYSEVHEYQNIAEAFKRAKDFDIIHCAVEQKSVIFADLVKTPSIHSIRYGEFFEQERDLLKRYKYLNYVGNSRFLKKLLPFLNWQGIIYNGLNYNDFIQKEKPGNYLLFLARLSPQKGVDTAIKLAKKLKMKLILAGKVSDADRDFLDKEVYPFIDGKQIVYKGEVLGEAKKKLLSEALCLIQPNRMIEAFGNTFLEAMASGVPVIAYDQGSMREVIETNKTGYVVNNFSEMVKALRLIKNINKKDCVDRAKKHFSLETMIDSYENLFYKIIEKSKK